MISAGEMLRRRARAGRQARDLRSDEFAGRESGILRYLVGRAFWEDSSRKVLVTVVGVASASDVWVKLPGGRYRALRAGYVRDAIDDRGVDAAGNDLGGPVDWSEAVRASRPLSLGGKDPFRAAPATVMPMSEEGDAPHDAASVPARHKRQPKPVTASEVPHVERARGRAQSTCPVQDHQDLKGRSGEEALLLPDVDAPAETPPRAASSVQRLREAGNCLWMYRERQGKGQKDLAEAIGESRGLVAMLENGLVRPTRDQRRKVAEALGLAEDAIWGDDLLKPGPGVDAAERSEARAFGLDCRMRRFDAGRTQAEIAERVGIPAWRLGQIEMGAGLLADLDVRQKLLKALERARA